MAVTVGIDWAEDHHDAAIMNHEGAVIARVRIDTGPDGLVTLLSLIAQHGGTPDDAPVAIETDKNLLVVALMDAGYTVYPINPRAAARYRERHSQSGRKSDAGDAAMLADIVRTDRHQHRPMPATSTQALAVKALARQHQEAIWALHDTINRLRSVWMEFYPQALQAFPNLKHRAAHTVLSAAPTPTAARKLSPRRVVTLLHKCGRRNDAALVAQVVGALHAPGLAQPAPVEAALGVAVSQLLAVVSVMTDGVATLEKQLALAYGAHPLAALVTSPPGLGPVLAARVLGEIGDDPARFPTAASLRCYAGTAPVTRASGKSSYVKARKVRNKRLADACHWWAFSTLTKSVGARAYYDRRRATGDRGLAVAAVGCGLVGTDLPTQRRWRPLRVDGTARRVAVRAEDDERAGLEHVLDVGASPALSRHLDRALFAVEGAAVGASVRPPALRTRVWIVWVWSSHRATRQASWMASRASGS